MCVRMSAKINKFQSWYNIQIMLLPSEDLKICCKNRALKIDKCETDICKTQLLLKKWACKLQKIEKPDQKMDAKMNQRKFQNLFYLFFVLSALIWQNMLIRSKNVFTGFKITSYSLQTLKRKEERKAQQIAKKQSLINEADNNVLRL